MDRAIRRTLQNEYRRQTRKRGGSARGSSRPAQATGGGAVTVAGQLFHGSGVNVPAGASVAVRNVGRPANALYVPDNASSVIYVTGAGGGAGGGGGDVPNPHNYSLYHSGTIPDAHAPQFLKLDGTRALEGNLPVNSGVTLDGVDLSAFKTLYDAHVLNPDAHHNRVTVGNGLSITAAQLLDLKLKTASALEKDGTGLSVAGSIAGNGLGWDDVSKVISVGHDASLQIISDQVGVNKAHDFTWTGAHVWDGSVRFNTSPQVNANINFLGAGERSITSLGNLVMSIGVDLRLEPGDDLWLDPGGFVMLADTAEVRTSSIVDLPTGIRGLRLFERPDAVNYWQLTMGAAKFDELYARVFVADETRIDRGEEYWSKSFGIVETSFTIPATGATVDVWFENAAETLTQNIFSVGDWLLLRSIDWTTGLLILKCWFQVDSLLVSGATDGVRQQWRIRRKKFGQTGAEIKAGNTILDAGTPGQGWIHLSVLGQDAGPFLQIGEFVAVVADEPVFEPRVRMGNLSGTVDYGAADAWGFVTGNDLSLEPDAGFSGVTSDAASGVRLFNVDLRNYDLGVLALQISEDTGIRLRQDDTLMGSNARFIAWYDSLEPLGSLRGEISSYSNSGVHTLSVHSFALGTERPRLVVGAVNDTAGSASMGFTGGSNGMIELNAPDIRFGGNSLKVMFGSSSIAAASLGHFYENNSKTDLAAGVTVEQDGTGDAVLHWHLSGGRYFSAGIDNSDGDKWKLSISHILGVSDVIVVDPATGIVTVNGLSAPGGGGSGDPVTAGDGIALVGQQVSVDSTVARSSTSIIAGAGLTGGGTLAANRTLAIALATLSGLQTTSGLALADSVAGDGLDISSKVLSVDSTVLRNNRAVYSGDGLFGGGALTEDRTLNVDGTVVRTWQNIYTGAGLTGGGNLTVDRTLAIALATVSGLSTTGGLNLADSVAGDGLSIAGKVLSVNSSVVRIARTLTAGDGLSGGGDLSANRSFAVDSTVVRTTRQVNTVAPLAGGGALSGNLSLSLTLASNSGLSVVGGLNLSDGVAGDGLTISAAKVLSVAGDVVRTSRVLATTGPLSGGGDLSANRTLSLTFAAISGLDEGAELALADSVAGAGLGIANKILTVNAAAGLRLDGDNVVVDLSHDFAWLGDHTFSTGVVTFDTDPQVAANLHFANEARSITGDGNLTLAPTGDLVFAPNGGGILPAGSGVTDLGDYNRKFGTIFAGEVYSETLVPQNVQATLGGRVLVTGTTALAEDVLVADTSIIVKHSTLVAGSYVRLEAAPGGVAQFEVMQITSGATPTAGGFQYSVTRNVNAAVSAFDWSAGDAVADLGSAVGAGYIDLTSVATVHGHLGPTVTIYSRTGTTTWDEVSPVVSMGNLSSFVDYFAPEFGFAVGNDLTLDGSSGFSGLTADSTSGMRLFNTNIEFYEAGEPILLLTPDAGLAMEAGSNEDDIAFLRRVSWYGDLSALDTDLPLAYIQATPRDIQDDTVLELVAGWRDGLGGFQDGVIRLVSLRENADVTLTMDDNLEVYMNAIQRLQVVDAYTLINRPLKITALEGSDIALVIDRLPNEASIQGWSDWLIMDGHAPAAGNVGLNYYSAGDVFIAQGGGDVLLAQGGGTVGIDLGTGGVVAWSSSFAALQIGTQGALFSDKASVSQTYLGNNVYTDGAFKRMAALPVSLYSLSNGAHNFRVAPTGAADSLITWTKGLYIDPSGNNGVGTESPNAQLHVFAGGSVGLPHPLTQLLVENDDSTMLTIATPSNKTGYLMFADAEGTTRGGMVYDHGADKLYLRAGGLDPVTVDASGNVGIGTPTPVAPLEVYGLAGGIAITRASSDEPYLTFRQGATPTAVAQIRGIAGGGVRLTDGSSVSEWARFTGLGAAMYTGLTVGYGGPSHLQNRLRVGPSNGANTGAILEFDNGTDAMFWFLEATGSGGKGHIRTDSARAIVLQDNSTSSGGVGVGIAPQGKFHIYDGVGGRLYVTKTGVGASEVEIIPDGTGDVVRGLTFSSLCHSSSGTLTGAGNSLTTPASSSVTAVMATNLVIRLYSTGRVTVQTTAGGDTWTVALNLLWL